MQVFFLGGVINQHIYTGKILCAGDCARNDDKVIGDLFDGEGETIFFGISFCVRTGKTVDGQFRAVVKDTVVDGSDQSIQPDPL